MFKRLLTKTLRNSVKSFPVVVLTGPRQSGKTTLLQTLFPKMHYVSLESPDILSRIQSDPRGFLDQSLDMGVIIDEAQVYPELFSYIQEYIDRHQRPGQFILSGSQNFLLLEKVSQTLAGRSAILELLPLSLAEIQSGIKKINADSSWDVIFAGGYPRPYQEKLDRPIWFNSYVQTYVERDVRSIINVKNIAQFQLFLKLCAGRHGQLLNMHELGNDTGLSHTTVSEWLGLLEASYIIYRLQPYHKNFNKRVVKTPKLYFYDSGLVCHLLGIESAEHLQQHVMRGAIFEGFVITEMIKNFFSIGRKAPIYFWRDRSGNEVDVLFDYAGKLVAYELKSSKTFSTTLLKSLHKWQAISGIEQDGFLVYGGNEGFSINGVTILPWFDVINIK